MVMHRLNSNKIAALTIVLTALVSVIAPAYGNDAVSAADRAVAQPETQPETQPAPATDEKVPFKAGQTLSVDTNVEDVVPTWDLAVAERQAAAYPDSPEAAFILAVAQSRTSNVEAALQEVQHAKKLTDGKGGAKYFDKMIATYEKMLIAYPDDNRVRYGLAWAYYMKAYLVGRDSRRAVNFKEKNPTLAAVVEEKQKADAAEAATVIAGYTSSDASGSAKVKYTKPAAVASPVPATKAGTNGDIVKALTSGNPIAAAAAIGNLANITQKGTPPPLTSIPHIPGALEGVDPIDVPQITFYFERSLQKIDELLKRDPNDVWSIDYGAHLRAEYTGNLADAMKTWKAVTVKYPNHPAAYFFLGEGYLKQGDLRESIKNISRALELRSM
jgi:tetratricopeptide (TPR) repeat protein